MPALLFACESCVATSLWAGTGWVEQLKKGLQRTLETFAKDMDVVSKDIQKFFDKHMRAAAADDLVGDFSTLFATLKSRMRKEENVLYADYDRLQ